MGCCSSSDAPDTGNNNKLQSAQQINSSHNNINQKMEKGNSNNNKLVADAGNLGSNTPMNNNNNAHGSGNEQPKTIQVAEAKSAAEKYETPGGQQEKTDHSHNNNNKQHETPSSNNQITNQEDNNNNQTSSAAAASSNETKSNSSGATNNNNNRYANSIFPLVKQSWSDAMETHDESKADSNNFGVIFYKTLFEDYPILPETLFKNTEATVQRSALVKVLSAAVGLLPPAGEPLPHALIDTLEVLGARHVLYGTEPAHYPLVGANVIKTLKIVLGDRFTPACEQEWLQLYGVISKTMIDAAEGERGESYRARFHKKRAGEFKSILEKTFQQSRTRLPEFSRLVLTYIINGPETCVPLNQTPALGTPTSIGRNTIFIEKESELVGRLSDCFSISIADCINKSSNIPVRELATEFIVYSNTPSSFYQFSDDDKATFPEALIAVLEMKRKAELSPFEKMIIGWFTDPFLAGIGGEKSTLSRAERMEQQQQHHHHHHHKKDMGAAGLGYPELPKLNHIAKTWDRVRKLNNDDSEKSFGKTFYRNLFGDHPGIHHTIFKDTSVDSQRMNLTRWLDKAVALFAESKTKELYDALDILGARHVLYGVDERHYPATTSAGMKAMKELLPDGEFTAEVESEWKAFFDLVSDRMIDAENSPLGTPYRNRFVQKRCREVEKILVNRYSNPFDAVAFSRKVLATIANESGECQDDEAAQLFAACFSSALSDAISVSNMRPVFSAGLEASNKSHYIRRIFGLSNDTSLDHTNSAGQQPNDNQTDVSDRLSGCFLTVLELKAGKLAFHEKYILECYLAHVVNGLVNKHQKQYDAQTTADTSKPAREDQLASYPLATKSWKHALEICGMNTNDNNNNNEEEDEQQKQQQQAAYHKLGEAHFNELFVANPLLAETHFKNTTISQHATGFTQTMNSIMHLLTNMPSAVDAIRMLGARHVLYGAEPEHYPMFTSALIKTVKKILVDNENSTNQHHHQHHAPSWDSSTQAEWEELMGIISNTMIDASRSSKAYPFSRRLNHKRVNEFDSILKRVASPFEPHVFARKICSIACGKDIPHGHSFADALTPVFAAALVEADSQQSLEPIIDAAADAGKSEAFDQFVIENANVFDSGNKMIAKKKIGAAVLGALQSCASADQTSGELLSPLDEVVVNFVIDRAIHKGLNRITLDEFDDLIKNKKLSLILMNPGARVINCTEFLLEHPPGEDVIQEHVGKDATDAFNSVLSPVTGERGHSESAKERVETLWIGNLTEMDYEKLMYRESSQQKQQ